MSLPIVESRPAAPDLRSFDLAALTEVVGAMGERPFRAGQLYKWLHQKYAVSFDEMTDLPKAFRERLVAEARLGELVLDKEQRSSDGTIKFRWRTEDGKAIESVYMPDDTGKKRRTLCISTQVGCAMGCGFCATGTMGLSRNLTPGEIVDQVHRVNRFLIEEGLEPGPRPLTNLVYMGMGEPLHNFENVKASLGILLSPQGPDFSNRHVTVSTAGIVPNILRLGAETDVKLAISLNATTDEVRDRVMPVNRRWKIADLMKACRDFPMKQGRRITFEYVLFDGINDTDDDLKRLAELVGDLPSKVNFIQYNRNEGLPYEPSPLERVDFFVEGLLRRGIQAMARKNRGRDILAACGQLAAEGGPGRKPAKGALTGRLERPI
ncbi:23S rRNA (adenine(2503)-C(2))-methyltransferase RlmN [Vulgatibacter incomptus]|uniref:Probable dual-specificity RNA methyltransferase RlmN n=1 Tax=Vulgatibacter incomptus TaxID=1391653 RepID=A0A0K1PBH2_9BACT|nr:23S rRNA (adenine(2503)-C(2))-methyltransferase RlmN [Vulgatibacter incomptus]AKU90888.1 Ribosomal RNA large subunit methyltransferase N [Vulgatibacter incomptus]